MKSGRNDLNGFKSGFREFFGNPFCGAFDVGLMLGLGAHAGDAKEFAEFVEILIAATFDKFSKVHSRTVEAQILSL